MKNFSIISVVRIHSLHSKKKQKKFPYLAKCTVFISRIAKYLKHLKFIGMLPFHLDQSANLQIEQNDKLVLYFKKIRLFFIVLTTIYNQNKTENIPSTIFEIFNRFYVTVSPRNK